MEPILKLAGENHVVDIFGIRLVGVNSENAQKLFITVLFVVIGLAISWFLRKLIQLVLKSYSNPRLEFWLRQIVKLLTAIIIFIGVASVWFDDPGRLTTALGLVTAGLAFALQKVVSAIAGYFIILRGKMFNVGDRITMGGVRGDVIALDFTRTTLMEMGQPPAVQSSEPAMWVKSRQYTGRVVTIANSKIFDEPVYNYTRDFPFIWEEITIPITYAADRERTEQILLEVANRHTSGLIEISEEALEKMKNKYFMRGADMHPRVYYRITDNWLELSLRFVAKDHGIRELKDRMNRDILSAFDKAGIGIASATYDIVGFPPLKIEASKNKPDTNT